MAQPLAVQRAVLAVVQDEIDHPADILEIMQDRFMAYITRSKMNWEQKLRADGKRIQDTTTALGSIIWSDDGKDLAYKGLELNMMRLKRFIALQVEAAQEQLHELLLVHLEEERAAVVPPLSLRSLKVDPSNKLLEGPTERGLARAGPVAAQPHPRPRLAPRGVPGCDGIRLVE